MPSSVRTRALMVILFPFLVRFCWFSSENHCPGFLTKKNIISNIQQHLYIISLRGKFLSGKLQPCQKTYVTAFLVTNRS